jgi:hypothetical protein
VIPAFRRLRAPVRPLPPLSVEWMVGVGRKAVVVAGVAIAALVNGPLALMTIAAQRAQRPEAEGVVIALMRRMVISDGGRRDAASFLAQGTQRGSRKLVFGPRPPALK